MRKTTKSPSGTSFHDTTVRTTIHTLLKLLGQPTIVDNTGLDKTNYEWEMETSDGDVFTVYDWKEYRILNEHEVIEFHIGGMSKAITEQAKNEIYDALESYSKKAK
jgi:hypothetical protein